MYRDLDEQRCSASLRQYFMSYFYRSANAVIAPDLASEMEGRRSLGLMTSLFFAAFAAVQILLGIGLIAGARAR